MTRRTTRMTRAEIDEWATASEIELLTCDGMDDAILGIGQRFNSYFVVYDRELAVKSLMTGGMNREDAEEFFEFNTVGAWVGEATPCFVIRHLG